MSRQNTPPNHEMSRYSLLQVVFQGVSCLVDGRSGGGSHHSIHPLFLGLIYAQICNYRSLPIHDHCSFLELMMPTGPRRRWMIGVVAPCQSTQIFSLLLYGNLLWKSMLQPSVTQSYSGHHPLTRMMDASPSLEIPLSEYSLNWFAFNSSFVASWWENTVVALLWELMLRTLGDMMEFDIGWFLSAGWVDVHRRGYGGNTLVIFFALSVWTTWLEIGSEFYCKFIISWFPFVHDYVLALSVTLFLLFTTWVGEFCNILVFVKSFSRSIVSLLIDIRMTNGVSLYGVIHLFWRMLFMCLAIIVDSEVLAFLPLSRLGVATRILVLKVGAVNCLCLLTWSTFWDVLFLFVIYNLGLKEFFSFRSCNCNPSGVG